MPDPTTLDGRFPRYTDFNPLVPVWCLTPPPERTACLTPNTPPGSAPPATKASIDDSSGCFHRFFDTNPVSPSGRYVAFTRMSPGQELTPNAAGEPAEVGVVDLATGQRRRVAETRGWEPQMGANVNWGIDDAQLIFNDVDPVTWQAFAVRCDVQTGEKTRLGGPVYHVSPDGRTAASSNIAAMRRTQPGYGVVVPDLHVPRFVGATPDDGLWLTDTQTGQTRLALSIRDAVARATPAFELEGKPVDAYEMYGFHAKWSPDGTKLIWTIRFFENDGTSRFHVQGTPAIRFTVLTVSPDGSQVCNAVPTHRWRRRGHHINWFPDSRSLSMNLQLEDDGPLKLVRCRADGADLRPIVDGVDGSGHPTVHPTAGRILTDMYAREPMAFPDGTTGLRWIDMKTGRERLVARYPSRTDAQAAHSVLRLDPHPAWDRTWRWVTFNAMIGGTRRLMLADFQTLLDPD